MAEPKTAMSVPSTPGLLEATLAFLSAARSTSGDVKAFYCARARSAFGDARAELEALRINLESLESTLPKEASHG